VRSSSGLDGTDEDGRGSGGRSIPVSSPQGSPFPARPGKATPKTLDFEAASSILFIARLLNQIDDLASEAQFHPAAPEVRDALQAIRRRCEDSTAGIDAMAVLVRHLKPRTALDDVR
jgi:hypothetical protein